MIDWFIMIVSWENHNAMYKGDSLKNDVRIGFVSNIVLYFIKEPPNTTQRPCRGGYQPPARLRLLSGWLNGEMLGICTNSPEPVCFFRVVPRGRLVASPTGGEWSSCRLPYISYLISWSDKRFVSILWHCFLNRNETYRYHNPAGEKTKSISGGRTLWNLP